MGASIRSGNNGAMQLALRGIALAAIVILFSMLVVGCVTQGANAGNAPGQMQNSMIGNGTNLTAENKTGYDITQHTIALAIADGTYSKDITYTYHPGTDKAGNEVVTVSVTVKDGVVTAASVTGHNPVPISAHFINGVNAALPDLVVGKKIAELNLPRQIAGSSLTAAAFDQYMAGLAQNSQSTTAG